MKQRSLVLCKSTPPVCYQATTRDTGQVAGAANSPIRQTGQLPHIHISDAAGEAVAAAAAAAVAAAAGNTGVGRGRRTIGGRG